MGFFEFAQVLEDRLHRDLNDDLNRDLGLNAQPPPQSTPYPKQQVTLDDAVLNLSYMMGSLGQKPDSQSVGRKYPQAPRPAQQHPPLIKRFNPDQQKAFNLLWKHGGRLPSTFTLRELQRAFRRAAKQAHPDAGGAADAFGHVKAAFDLLKQDALLRTDPA